MRLLRTLAAVLLALSVLLATEGAAYAQIEDYAEYQPQTKCSPQAKPGTKALGRWLVRRGRWLRPDLAVVPGRRHVGAQGGPGLRLDPGRARKKDRLLAREFLELAFATDKQGNEHAKARRMGIMYIIWNDHMYSAWEQFEREDYLSSSCKKRKHCSATLRHRNHMHISLSRRGGRGLTSWYDGRVH